MSPSPIELPVEGLSDGIVRLRPIAEADIDAVTAACQDPEIARYTTIPAPYERHHAREWMSASAAGIASGTDLGLLAVDAETGRLLGSVGLHSLDPVSGRCSSGYWIAREARGRGIAARALRLLCGFAFDELNVRRVELWIEPENAASRRVAGAVGFVCEGRLRSFMVINGARRDMLMYSLLPADLR